MCFIASGDDETACRAAVKDFSRMRSQIYSWCLYLGEIDVSYFKNSFAIVRTSRRLVRETRQVPSGKDRDIVVSRAMFGQDEVSESAGDARAQYRRDGET